MNDLDQLIRDTLSVRATEAPHAAPVVERTLTGTGTRARRWRSPMLAVVAASAVAAGGIGTALAWQAAPEETPVASSPALAGPAGGPLERCLEIGAPALDEAHWGDGSRVLTSSSAGDRAAAVLVSADEEQWASCRLLSASSGLVDVYPMQPAAPGTNEFSHSATTMIERFPDNVAEVRLTLRSGEEITAPSVDGFVAVELAGAELDGTSLVLRQYDAGGALVGGPELVGGDADLPVEQRSLVPNRPVASAEAGVED